MKKVKLLLVLILTCFSLYPSLAQNNQNDHYIVGKTLDNGTISIALDQQDFKTMGRTVQATDIYNAGLAYYYGRGVKIDYKMAFKCFQIASELGLVPSQLALAVCYMDGRGVTENDSLAFSLVQKSAELGFSQSICMLGTCYLAGVGTQKDTARAVSCFKKGGR
jgi:TPR repeat protein